MAKSRYLAELKGKVLGERVLVQRLIKYKGQKKVFLWLPWHKTDVLICKSVTADDANFEGVDGLEL